MISRERDGTVYVIIAGLRDRRGHNELNIEALIAPLDHKLTLSIFTVRRVKKTAIRGSTVLCVLDSYTILLIR